MMGGGCLGGDPLYKTLTTLSGQITISADKLSASWGNAAFNEVSFFLGDAKTSGKFAIELTPSVTRGSSVNGFGLCDVISSTKRNKTVNSICVDNSTNYYSNTTGAGFSNGGGAGIECIAGTKNLFILDFDNRRIGRVNTTNGLLTWPTLSMPGTNPMTVFITAVTYWNQAIAINVGQEPFSAYNLARIPAGVQLGYY